MIQQSFNYSSEQLSVVLVRFKDETKFGSVLRLFYIT